MEPLTELRRVHLRCDRHGEEVETWTYIGEVTSAGQPVDPTDDGAVCPICGEPGEPSSGE